MKDKHYFSRMAGARMAWNDIVDNKKIVKLENNWYTILKAPRSKGFGNYGGVYVEIGYLAMIQHVFLPLVSSKQRFKLEWMEHWIQGGDMEEDMKKIERKLGVNGEKNDPDTD